MIKIISIVLLTFGLAACQTTGSSTILTRQVPVVIKPPETLYVCPQVTVYPSKPTNKQVANLIVKLDSNNKICYNSLRSIKKYVDAAEKNYSK